MSDSNKENKRAHTMPCPQQPVCSFRTRSDYFRVLYIVTYFSKNTEESVGLEAMIYAAY